jgi:replicative DNA helicase
MAEINAQRTPNNAGGNGNNLADLAPPHDEEAETSVLGAIMLAERWLDTVTVETHLQPSDFYRPRHRTIFQAMLDISAADEPIDTLTVAARLTETALLEEAGGRDYIETLVARIPAIANTRQYAQIVKENSLLRGLLRATQDIQQSVSGREADPQELLERAQQSVFEVAQDSQSGELVQLADILHDELERIEHQWKHGSAVTGTTTGFKDVDELTGGLQPGNLIIIAARPSMGKSALVTNIAENAALDGKPVALFSLEMSKTELSQRFLASQAKESGDAMRKGTLKKSSWPKVLEAAQVLSNAPLWIDDSSDISIIELRAKARRLHGKFLSGDGEGLGLIIVDYLQLLRANDGRDSRVEQVAQMSRGLKILARELNVPVIAVSQLSRAVESRMPPRPQLSDLRESGQIEQDADVVCFIYREEYYLREESEKKGIAELIFAKHRNGPVGDVELTFISHYPKFANKPKGYGEASERGDRVPAGRISDGYPEEPPYANDYPQDIPDL